MITFAAGNPVAEAGDPPVYLHTAKREGERLASRWILNGQGGFKNVVAAHLVLVHTLVHRIGV